MVAPVLSTAPSPCLCSASPHCCPAPVSVSGWVCYNRREGAGDCAEGSVDFNHVSHSYAVRLIKRDQQRISPSPGVHLPLPLAHFCQSLCIHTYRSNFTLTHHVLYMSARLFLNIWQIKMFRSFPFALHLHYNSLICLEPYLDRMELQFLISCSLLPCWLVLVTVKNFWMGMKERWRVEVRKENIDTSSACTGSTQILPILPA